MGKYISPIEYAKKHGNIGPEQVKKMIRKGELQGFVTEGGHYKVLDAEEGYVSKEQYEKVLTKLVQAETKLKAVTKILQEVG